MAILGNGNNDESTKKRRPLLGNKVASGTDDLGGASGKQPRRALLGSKVADGLAMHTEGKKKPKPGKAKVKTVLKTALRRMLR